MSNKQVKTSYGNVKLRRIVLGCLTLMVAILLIAYLCISQYYKQHFFAKTYINGMDCSNMTAEEAKAAITTGVKDYALTVAARGVSEQKITGQQIGLTCQFDKDVADALKDQSSYTWLGNALKENKIDSPYKLSFDQDKLDKSVQGLNCMAKDKQVEPKNASISKYQEGTGFSIVKEEPGAKLDKKKVANAITDSINGLKDKVSLEEKDCYKKPSVTSEDSTLKSAMDKINKYMQTKLTYKFGDKTEIFDEKQIGPAITVDKNCNVSINQEKIKEYITYLDKKYTTSGGTWKFTDGYGEEKTVKGGSYGWTMANAKELKEVMACLEAGEQKDKAPHGLNDVVYGEDKIGNTYVEVNLAKQHIFLIKDGKKIYDAPCITGNPNSNHATPAGVYKIDDMKRNATLRGPNADGSQYACPVAYWMPFNGGIGLHDATWQDGHYAQGAYLYRGSHGCVNLTLTSARTIFNNITCGTPVVVYR